MVRKLYLNEAFSDQKHLNYHIFSVNENGRFQIAILEFNDDYKHIFVDKHNHETMGCNENNDTTYLYADFPAPKKLQGT